MTVHKQVDRPVAAGAVRGHHTTPEDHMTSPLRLGSLCTGYAGLEMAVTAALAARGIATTTSWVADPDPGAAAVDLLLDRAGIDLAALALEVSR